MEILPISTTKKKLKRCLMNEFAETIYAVADDASLDIRFNPGIVKEYRLIGFDNKLSALTDSTSEVQGGEIGSGHSLVAVVELLSQTSIQKISTRAKRDLQN